MRGARFILPLGIIALFRTKGSKLISRGTTPTAYAAVVFILASGMSAVTAANENRNTVETLKEQTEAAGEVMEAKSFFVMPIPISNPTIGTGLGLTAMRLFQAGENAPPSSVTLAGLYTDTDTWAAAAGTKTYFADDKYRLSGWLGYFNANLQFFGVGSDAGDRGQSIDITQKGPFLIGEFLIQVADDFYIGPKLRYIGVDTSLQEGTLPPDFPPVPEEIPIPDRFKNVSSGIGVVMEVDTRDNRFFAHKGSYLKATTNFARNWLGSDRNYEQFELGYNYYRPLGENGFIAWRATGCFREGDTPFWDLCMFGGEEDAIRGYVGGQYRDKVSLTTQVEYRLRVYKKWGLVAFAGVGQVAPQVDEIEFDDLLPSGGIGIRFMASEDERVNLSIDYARGRDSDAWYFRIGEAF